MRNLAVIPNKAAQFLSRNCRLELAEVGRHLRELQLIAGLGRRDIFAEDPPEVGDQRTLQWRWRG
jgi:hypothetical protein